MKTFLGLIDCWFVFKIKPEREMSKCLVLKSIIVPAPSSFFNLDENKSKEDKINLPIQKEKKEKDEDEVEELTLIDWWITLKEKPLTVSVFNEEEKKRKKKNIIQ